MFITKFSPTTGFELLTTGTRSDLLPTTPKPRKSIFRLNFGYKLVKCRGSKVRGPAKGQSSRAMPKMQNWIRKRWLWWLWCWWCKWESFQSLVMLLFLVKTGIFFAYFPSFQKMISILQQRDKLFNWYPMAGFEFVTSCSWVSSNNQ